MGILARVERWALSKRIPGFLRIHQENVAAPRSPSELPGLDGLLRSFHEATGWSLTVADGPRASKLWRQPGVQSAAAGQSAASEATPLLILGEPRRSTTRDAATIPRDKAEELATAMAHMLAELHRTREALWEREAELAAGVPVSPRSDEDEHLAERLESVLRSGTESVGCHAAAVYMLDEATSELKLRATWGLPRRRLLESARPLRGQVADLEALLGHAVVLEDTRRLPQWKPPEPCAAAVCLPVSSPSMPLGTMWIFGNEPREFTDAETGILEIVAGRIAAELERVVLLEQGQRARRLERDFAEGAWWQIERLPTVAPLLDDWQVAGWTSSVAPLAGTFHDWMVLADGMLAATVGGAVGSPLARGLTLAALHGAFKAHVSCRPEHGRDPTGLVRAVNETCWGASTGNQLGALCHVEIAPESGDLTIAAAGGPWALVVRPKGIELVSGEAGPLGADAELVPVSKRLRLRRGDHVLLVAEVGIDHDSLAPATSLAEHLASQPRATTAELLAAARAWLENQQPGTSRSLVTIGYVGR